MMISFVAPGKTRSTSASQRSAPFGILPPRTSGKLASFNRVSFRVRVSNFAHLLVAFRLQRDDRHLGLGGEHRVCCRGRGRVQAEAVLVAVEGFEARAAARENETDGLAAIGDVNEGRSAWS